MFHAAAGDLICVDNYRLTHGRDGYSDPGRVMLSIWGWSTAAVAVPVGPLDIVRPVIPASGVKRRNASDIHVSRGGNYATLASAQSGRYGAPS